MGGVDFASWSRRESAQSAFQSIQWKEEFVLENRLCQESFMLSVVLRLNSGSGSKDLR